MHNVSRYSRWNKIMLFVVYFVWVWMSVGANSLFRFILEQPNTLNMEKRKNEYKFINEHFGIFQRQTVNVHNRQFTINYFYLLLIEFPCYYHQCDRYSQQSIEWVVMHFFKKSFLQAYEGHDFFSVLTHCIIVLYIQRCNV